MHDVVGKAMMMVLARCVVLVALVASGCRPDNTGGDAGSPFSVTDAGGAEDAGHDAGNVTPDAGPERNSGYVTLTSSLQPAGTRANATFLPGGPAYLCPETRVGACVYYACTRRTPPDGLPAPSAGAINVTGGLHAVNFLPLGDGTYDTVLTHTALWNGGETLGVQAAGADVPAFQDSVVAPMPITLTAPVPSDPWTLSRSADVTLNWTGGTTEEVVATFGTLANNDPTEVECTFTANLGSGTVLAAALAMLPAGDGYYEVLARTRHVVPAGAWHVTVRAESDAILATGAPVNGGLLLQ